MNFLSDLELPSTEDKDAWCEIGESKERDFLERCWKQGVGVSRNPDKVSNPYSFDALITFPADIKSASTPFYTAGRYGIDPNYAVTLNGKDVERYRTKYPAIILIFDVAHHLYQGTHIAPLSQVVDKIQSGEAKRHDYQKRVGDKRNAQYSYVLDVRWFPLISRPTEV